MRLLKSGVKRLLGTSWRCLPPSMRSFLFRQILAAESQGDAADSLRRLFAFDDELDQAIINASTAYGAGIHPKHRLMKYHQFFIDRSKGARRILDVGCGRGIVSHEMVMQLPDAEIVGVDADETCIRFARKHFEHARLRFVRGMAPQDLSGETFDVVVLSNVLEHVDKRQDFLQELTRLCSPAKTLVRLPLFDRDWVIPLRKELGLPYFSDSTHFAELTASEWIGEVESADLEVTHHEIRWGEIWLEARQRCGP